MCIDIETIRDILETVFGDEFPMKNSNFWNRVSSQVADLLRKVPKSKYRKKPDEN